MPPSNDNIANAEAISGSSGSTTGDNTGATLETNEAECLCYTTATRFFDDVFPTSPAFGYGGGRTVWYVWTCPSDGWYKFETSSGGGSPIGDTIISAIFGTDFSTARLAGPDDDSGTGNYSAITFYAFAGLTYHIAVDGYNGTPTDDAGYLITDTAEGTFTLSWGAGSQADALYRMVKAADDYNSGSSTTSLQTNTREEVRDTQVPISASGKQYGILEDATDSFYVRNGRLPLPGYYKVEIKHCESVGSGTDDFTVGMILSGMTILPPKFDQYTTGLNDVNKELTNATNTRTTEGAWILPIGINDELAFRLITALNNSRHFDIYAVKFSPADKIASLASPTKFWTVDDLMLGATTTPVDLDNDGAFVCKDVCVTSDGVVWAVFFQDDIHQIVLKKFSGGSWSTVESDVGSLSGVTFDDNNESALAIDTDGTYVYIAYGSPDGTQTTGNDGTSALVHYNWKWHVQKYDPGGNSFTELGSGQRHFSPGTSFAALAGYFNRGLELKIAPNGVPWVGLCEVDTSKGSYTAPTSSRGFISYWNGSSWTEVSVPDPPSLHSATDFIINPTSTDDVRHLEFCFTHHNGSNNNPSIIYCAEYPTGTTPRHDFIYSEYGGSSWGNTLQFKAEDIWSGLGTSSNGSISQGHDLLDGSVPTFVGAFLEGDVDKVAVAKLLSDGSAFSAYSGHEHPSACAPQPTSPTTVQAIYIGTSLIILLSSSVGGNCILVDEEFGSGQGYHVAAKANTLVVPFEQSIGFSRIYAKGTSAYLIGASRSFDADTLGVYLGVWKIIGAGKISDYSLTPLR